jgi:hypothetical protein
MASNRFPKAHGVQITSRSVMFALFCVVPVRYRTGIHVEGFGGQPVRIDILLFVMVYS